MSKKIVITGGPGGGKTTALDLFRREFNSVKVVPEAATILFSGGVPRISEPHISKEIQLGIYCLQQKLEDIYAAMHPGSLLICDRGSLDGKAYWPQGEDDFFKSINSTYQQELERYAAVIFFETAASSNMQIDNNNPIRTESNDAAIEIDKKLQFVWQAHHNYHFVPSSHSFIEKINLGISMISNALEKL